MTKRVIACLAALTLALSLLPVTALADEPEVQTPNTTVEVSGGESGASQSEGTTTGGTEETGSTEGEGTGSGDESQETAYVAQIGEDKYATLDEAIEAAEDGATITLLADCETAGLNLSKDLTIAGSTEKTFTVTFKDKGIALWGKALTFKNCAVSMTGIGSTPYTAEWNWMTICASKDASLTLENATMTMDGTGTGKKAHAIYFCSNNRLNLTDSKLTIRNYAQDALEWDGGNGGYNVNFTNSTFVSDHNRSGFTGIFVATVDNSKVDVINSTGNGSNGSHFDIKNGSVVRFNDNGSHGLSAGWLTIDNSTVEALRNGANGVHTGSTLTIRNNAVVTIRENRCTISSKWTIPGALHVTGGQGSTIDATSTVTITDNLGSGILLKSGDLTVAEGAKLTITNNKAEKLGQGGGVNVRGNLVLPEGTVLYNNHAAEAGDDIYSTGTITFGSVGSNWTLNSDPDCGHRIDGWYYDGQETKNVPVEGTNEVVPTPIRWNGKTTKDGLCLEGRDEYYKLYAPTKEAVSAPLALKAAHGYLNNNPPVIRDQYYTVTVNYVDEAGNTVAPSYSTGSLKSGTAYDVTAQDAIAIPGYTYKTTTGDPTTGTLNGNKVVTVVYTKTADIDDGNTPTDPGDPGSDIDDPNTPTSPAEPPKTGDMMPLFAALTTLSAAAIVLLAKKREEA